MKKLTATSLFALVVTPLLAAYGAQAVPILPDFSAATFVPSAPVSHPYFPLTDFGTTRAYEGEKEEDGEIVTERFELTNFPDGPTILGVPTTTQRDRAFEGGLLVEETFDYYAQDTNGNVWYFGEDVTNFIYDDDGNLIETNSESAWRAGVNDALPGYIMPADLTVGFNYYQEFAAADEALDSAITFALGEIVTLEIGTFSDVLQVLELNELEPDSRGFKYYAPGRGLILEEEGLDEDLMNPELRIEFVPEPGTWTLLGIGLLGLWASRWRPTASADKPLAGC